MTDKIRIAIQESELSEEVIEMAREYYSNEWSKSSFEYEKKGFYKWCANSIEGQRRVLELGCGCGFSTYSMLSNNHEVVAIEENPFMLDHAEKLLTKRNCEFEIIRRGNLIFNNPSYQIQYSDMTNDQTQRNLLVEGDFLVDEKLNTWLICTEKFDAIACWFLGVHGVMTANVDHVQQYGFTKYDPVEYRLNFQRQLFAKADLVLKKGGIVNIIDRTLFFENEENKLRVLSELKDLYGIENWGFELIYVDQMKIEDPSLIPGVTLKVNDISGVIESDEVKSFAITSLVFVKN